MDTVVNTYLKAVVGHLRAQARGLEEWEGLCDEKLDPRRVHKHGGTAKDG